MKNLQLVVDGDACAHCGACVRDCPDSVIRLVDGLPAVNPETREYCIECQHCIAVCPTGALSALGRDPAASISLSREAFPNRQQMKTLVRGRRSVRQFCDADVRGDIIDDLLSDAAHAPTGCNDRALSFLVVDTREVMRHLREDIVCAIEMGVAKGLSMPEFLPSAAAAFRRDGTDRIFRGAPHLLIASAASRALCGKQDVIIALSYFELLAQTAGLGTTWCGMLDFVVGALPEVRDTLGIEKDAAFYGMMFGYPAVRYARTVQRDTAADVRRYRG